MVKMLKNPTEISFDDLGFTNQLASYSLSYGHFSPAVGHESEGRGFYIRILGGRSWRGNTTHTSWEYFKVDESGLITESPRGMAKRYNGRVRIKLDTLEQAVEEYKEKRVNQ